MMLKDWYLHLGKEKSKNDHSVPFASKRFKFPENADDVSSSIKFEDSETKPSIKKVSNFVKSSFVRF